MSGYLGSGDSGKAERVKVDGKLIFSELLRKAAYQALDDLEHNIAPNPLLIEDLGQLATQQPYPSHQAAYLLEQINARSNNSATE